MRRSYYNLMYRGSGESYIYNTLSGALISFSDDSQLEQSLQIGIEDEKSSERRILSEAGMIVNSYSDEVARLRVRENIVRYRGTSNSVALLMTKRCNFRCKYCFETHDNIDVNADVMEHVVKYIRKYMVHEGKLGFSWYGGEPLLEFEKMRILNRHIQQFVTDKDIEYYGKLTTNGYLLTKDVSAQIIKEFNLSLVSITIDGIEEDHNFSRPLANGKGTFKRIVSNVVDFVKLCERNESKMEVLIRINISKKNYSGIKEFVEYLSTIVNPSMVKLNFHPVHRLSNVNSDYDEYLISSTDEYRDKAEIKTDFGKIAKMYGFNGENAQDTFPWRFGKYCGVESYHSVVIGPKGELYKCGAHVEDGDVVGRLDESGGLQYNNKAIAKWIELPYEKCKKCQLRPVCSGGCRALIDVGTHYCGITKDRIGKEIEKVSNGEEVHPIYKYLFVKYE